MPLKLKGQTEAETADMLARAHAKRLEKVQAALEVWREYEAQYLTPLDQKEALALFHALEEAAEAKFPFVHVRPESKNEPIAHPELAPWFNRIRGVMSETVNSAWGAGYVLGLMTGLLGDGQVDGEAVMMWKAKRGTPHPPVILRELGIVIPDDEIELGSRPYFAPPSGEATRVQTSPEASFIMGALLSKRQNVTDTCEVRRKGQLEALTLPRIHPWDSGSRYASPFGLVSLTQLRGVPCTPPAAT